MALARVFADPNCFSYQELFPGGFTPQFGGDVQRLLGRRRHPRPDRRAPVLGRERGLRLERGGLLHQQHRERLAGSRLPTSFDPGLYKQEEVNVNLRLGYPLNSTVHLAGGLEWRDEKFTIGVGQRESWVNGPFADQGFSAASNGFPGFSPDLGGQTGAAATSRATWTRRRAGAPTGRVGVAARFEHFADFGSTLNGKLAGRYDFNPNFALRGSVSTGFRAPTPGQSNAYNVSTQFDLVPDRPREQRHHPVDLAGGGAARRQAARVAEKSVNYSVGAVLRGGQGARSRPTCSGSTCATAWPSPRTSP